MDFSGRSSDNEAMSSSTKTPRCERHVDRDAELYCDTCALPICVACATTRHLRTTGHHCLDIADAVDQCRSKLARRAEELTDRHVNCLSRIENTNARIESIRSKRPFNNYITLETIYSGLSKSNFKDHYGNAVKTWCLWMVAANLSADSQPKSVGLV